MTFLTFLYRLRKNFTDLPGVIYGDDPHHIPCVHYTCTWLTFVDSIPLCVNVYFNMCLICFMCFFNPEFWEPHSEKSRARTSVNQLCANSVAWLGKASAIDPPFGDGNNPILVPGEASQIACGRAELGHQFRLVVSSPPIVVESKQSLKPPSGI